MPASVQLPMPTKALDRPVAQAAAAARDPFFSASLQRKHPMYVVPIKTLLAPSFSHFRPHEELMAAGALVKYDDSMAGSVLFISHAWLRGDHPDNEQGVKFALLCAVLRRGAEGSLDVSPHFVIDLTFKKAARPFHLRAADLRRDLADGYVFMVRAALTW